MLIKLNPADSFGTAKITVNLFLSMDSRIDSFFFKKKTNLDNTVKYTGPVEIEAKNIPEHVYVLITNEIGKQN